MLRIKYLYMVPITFCDMQSTDTIASYLSAHNPDSWHNSGIAWRFGWICAINCCFVLTDGDYPLSLFCLCYMCFLIALCLPHSSFLLLHVLDSWIIPRWCSRAHFAQSFCSAPQSSSAFVAFNIFSLFLLLKWRFIVSYAPKCMELNGIMWSLFALLDLLASQ